MDQVDYSMLYKELRVATGRFILLNLFLFIVIPLTCSPDLEIESLDLGDHKNTTTYSDSLSLLLEIDWWGDDWEYRSKIVILNNKNAKSNVDVSIMFDTELVI